MKIQGVLKASVFLGLIHSMRKFGAELFLSLLELVRKKIKGRD